MADARISTLAGTQGNLRSIFHDENCAAFFALLLAAAAPLQDEPSRVWKLWDGKAPGDFTVPGPELVTPPKPGENPPILRLTNLAGPRIEIYEPAAA